MQSRHQLILANAPSTPQISLPSRSGHIALRCCDFLAQKYCISDAIHPFALRRLPTVELCSPCGEVPWTTAVASHRARDSSPAITLTVSVKCLGFSHARDAVYGIWNVKIGGLRPILDLRHLNSSLYKGKFKMLTMKTIMSQIQGGDWFVTIDLKDAYFHIQVIQRHRRFLRFAFGGKAYQYKVLPFGLALAPRTFTKCMDAALAPLRLQGIRVLNYLDDWLILAHSRELVSRHRDIVLRHINSLGLRMNAKKSVLLPSQRTLFLGVRLDSTQMQALLAPAQIYNFTTCLARFKLGRHVSVGSCCRLLGLTAAASPVLPLGLLHMRPFLWWMKELRLHPTVPAIRLIRVSRSCSRPLLQWRDPAFLRSGVRIGAIHCRHMVTTDASMAGWGAVFEGRPASGEWTGEFLSWHIYCLELRAVFLALMFFSPSSGGGHHILVRTDNMAVVSHINRQGGSRSRTLDRIARRLLLWSQYEFLSLRAVHVPGILNLTADFLSRQKLRPGEWMLNRQTVSQIWDLFVEAEVDLFASQDSDSFPNDSGHRCVRPSMAECQSIRVLRQ